MTAGLANEHHLKTVRTSQYFDRLISKKTIIINNIFFSITSFKFELIYTRDAVGNEFSETENLLDVNDSPTA